MDAMKIELAQKINHVLHAVGLEQIDMLRLGDVPVYLLSLYWREVVQITTSKSSFSRLISLQHNNHPL